MNKTFLAVFLALLVCQSLSKMGMTWAVTVSPVESNNWVGKIECDSGNCNPYTGDTDCATSLPILCILHHKVIRRPFYDFARNCVGCASTDNSYYNGWIGGVFATTKLVKGSAIINRAAGDSLCRAELGTSAVMAEFHDGFWISYMNDSPAKIKVNWNWSSSVPGAWGAWGYFNSIKTSSRMWTWVNDQPTGNCGSL
jgi:hypothetical protein